LSREADEQVGDRLRLCAFEQPGLSGAHGFQLNAETPGTQPSQL
jgi:hypothetical protein